MALRQRMRSDANYPTCPSIGVLGQQAMPIAIRAIPVTGCCWYAGTANPTSPIRGVRIGIDVPMSMLIRVDKVIE
jgi:hypothetical protein